MVSTQSPLVTDNPNKASQCHSFTLVPVRSRSKDIILQKGKIFIHLHFPIDCLTHLYYFPSDETNSFLNPRYFRTEPKSGTTNHLPTSIWSQMKFLLNEIFVSTNNKSVDYFKLIWKMTISYFFHIFVSVFELRLVGLYYQKALSRMVSLSNSHQSLANRLSPHRPISVYFLILTDKQARLIAPLF